MLVSRSRNRGKKQAGNGGRRRPVRSRRTGWLAAGCAVLVAALIATGAWWFHRATAEAVVIPEFSAKARAGARLFSANCAVCHGENATGTEQGPPLLHKIYEPGHHPDASFQRAVKARRDEPSLALRAHAARTGAFAKGRVENHRLRARAPARERHLLNALIISARIGRHACSSGPVMNRGRVVAVAVVRSAPRLRSRPQPASSNAPMKRALCAEHRHRTRRPQDSGRHDARGLELSSDPAKSAFLDDSLSTA